MKKEIEVFPKVFLAGKPQKIFVRVPGAAEVKIRIQGMESYTVPHRKYRIDEDERYELYDMRKEEESLFGFEYDFPTEQKYSLTFLIDGEKAVERVYAVKSDLFGLRVFKGDTHLHTNYSDGEGSPFEVGVNYRRKGYDFIAITDHHKLFPSFIGQEEFAALTSEFFVFHGEEVHNKNMGYFHVINFGGDESVNTVIQETPEVMERETERILKTTDFPEGVDKVVAAHRIFMAEYIKKFGGIAVFPHPFWDAYGEYNAQTEDIKFLLKGGYFDALEVFGGNDFNFNGDNLMSALLSELKAEGVKIGIVGCSDAHSETAESSRFNKLFTLVFAKDFDGIKDAIKGGDSVAVRYRGEGDFWVYGDFRLVKYARFLLDEYFPKYAALCEKHAFALSEKDGEKIKTAENEIEAFRKTFFARKASIVSFSI